MLPLHPRINLKRTQRPRLDSSGGALVSGGQCSPSGCPVFRRGASAALPLGSAKADRQEPQRPFPMCHFPFPTARQHGTWRTRCSAKTRGLVKVEDARVDVFATKRRDTATDLHSFFGYSDPLRPMSLAASTTAADRSKLPRYIASADGVPKPAKRRLRNSRTHVHLIPTDHPNRDPTRRNDVRNQNHVEIAPVLMLHNALT